jgi:hypothetical protein
MGGIFSTEEGSCFAATQYLLAGLPVISVKSRGGRDVWFTSNNSIICENDPFDVERCVDIMKLKLSSGEVSSDNIRQECIRLMETFRKTFEEYLIEKLSKKFGVRVDHILRNPTMAKTLSFQNI